MFKLSKLLVLSTSLVLVIYLQGCIDDSKAENSSTTNQTQTQNQIAFTILATSSGGRADHRKIEVIGSQHEFNAAYYEVSPDSSLAPNVDFTQSMVIGAYMSINNSGGYSISFDSVNSTDTYIEVNVKSIVPGASCITSQVITSPFQFISIAKTTKPIIFKESHSTTNC